MSEFVKKCRELGEKRWKLAEKIETAEEFEKFIFQLPEFPVKFCKDLSNCWTVNFEYYVKDFLAEVGFFIDIMGLKPKGFDKEYIMFKGLENEFFFGFWASDEKVPATPKGALRMMFWVSNPIEVGETLKKRGAEFVDEMKPAQEGGSFYQAKLITPNGIVIQIWGDINMK